MWKLKIAEGGNPWLRTLNNHVGRHVWEFDPKLGSPEDLAEIENARHNFSNHRFEKKHSADLLMRFQFAKENPGGTVLPQVKVKDTDDVTEEIVTNTLKRGISYHSTLQAHDGHWPGDYGGPMFLLPGLVITLSITGALNAVLSEEHKKEMCRYLYNHQNKDGGWGLHIEGPSTMFGSVLNYVTLRLLGEGANGGEGEMEKGRNWILSHGGATAITSWGKMWLSVLGAFEWSGNNPLPPEIWLLPYLLPIHPGRMWCHSRMVYLPMSYLYGKRFVGPVTPTILSLRKEIYTVPYRDIDWNQARNLCAKQQLRQWNTWSGWRIRIWVAWTNQIRAELRGSLQKTYGVRSSIIICFRKAQDELYKCYEDSVLCNISQQAQIRSSISLREYLSWMRAGRRAELRGPL